MFGSQYIVLSLLIILIAAPMNVNASWVSTVATATICGGAALVAAPIAISLVGFTAGGIAAGSWAASMMSTAAAASGGSIAAGSVVATLQSIGAAGLGYAGTAAVTAAGAVTGAAAEAVISKVL